VRGGNEKVAVALKQRLIEAERLDHGEPVSLRIVLPEQAGDRVAGVVEQAERDQADGE